MAKKSLNIAEAMETKDIVDIVEEQYRKKMMEKEMIQTNGSEQKKGSPITQEKYVLRYSSDIKRRANILAGIQTTQKGVRVSLNEIYIQAILEYLKKSGV